jgi:murein DD-endopeptidase MepM/ murein hydrolase activator NlpD
VRLVNPPPGADNLITYFNGAAYPMVAEGDHWYRMIGLDPGFGVGDYTLEVSTDAAAIAGGTLSVADGGFEFIEIELPPSSIGLLQDQAAIAQERATLASVFAGFTPQQLWSGAWVMPAAGDISNAFGVQRSINGGAYNPHTGTDIANAKGTPVVAAAGGKVALAQPLYLYGNVVIIDHGAGVFSGYNHLDSIAVAAGQTVTTGQLIGGMGETGFVSGPHVHWEAVIGGVRTDPTLWVGAAIEP